MCSVNSKTNTAILDSPPTHLSLNSSLPTKVPAGVLTEVKSPLENSVALHCASYFEVTCVYCDTPFSSRNKLHAYLVENKEHPVGEKSWKSL